ncbi:hypothetical protein QQ39_13025 [Pragia fontium]|nr:hypothetical protein QQ39_13025 [Pragia fontium]
MAIDGVDSQEIAIRRIAITRNLGDLGNTYIVAMCNILLYICSYSYLYIYGYSRRCKYSLVITLFLSCFLLIQNSEKGPIFFYVLGALVCWGMSKRKMIKVDVRLSLGIFSLILLMYYLFVSSDFNLIFNLLFDRILIAQVAAVYLSFDFYNDEFGTLLFSSVQGFFFKVLGYDQVAPASTVLMKVYFPDMILNGGWNINGLYIHEAWANFGIFGVILSPLWVGIINGIIFILLISIKKRPFYVAIFSYVSSRAIFFLTSFNAYIYNPEVIIVVILIFIYFFLIGVLKIYEKSNI